MKSTFSWFLQMQGNNPQYQNHTGQGPMPSPNLKVEKPSYNSVIIQSNKQTLQNTVIQSPNSSPQRSPVKSLRMVPSKNFNQKFNPFSLENVVTEYENECTFNETDITSLGIDFESDKPILPYLKSIVSDLPFGSSTTYRIPASFNFKQPQSLNPFIKFASDETLLYIFYSQPRSQQQVDAANELKSRNYTFNQFWENKEGVIFDPQSWKFVHKDT